MGSTAISEAIKPPADGRQPWGDYFMSLAQSVSTRATCSRLRVGAVFTRDNRILVTGHNGALPGRQHCDEVGCLMHNNNCVRAVHAEENAVAQAALHGLSLEGSTLFVTHLPCLRCFKLALSAGCAKVFYKEPYGDAPMEIYHGLQGMTRLEQIK